MKSFSQAKVMVTGAAGFLGRYIIPDLLRLNSDVAGLDTENGLNNGNLRGLESKVQLIEADITDPNQIQKVKGQYDYVIHLAAMASPWRCEEEPTEAFRVNVQGTYNVLKQALEWRARRFIFASTAHVYGISPKYMPTDEQHPLALQDAYTTTKIIGESLCQLFHGNHGLGYMSLRIYNSYGPGQSTDYFIPAMIIKAKTGHIALRGRHITKDFVYVSDVVEAFRSAIVSDYIGEINIGSGVQTSLEVVARYIAKACGAELSFEETSDKGPTHMQSHTSRALTVLGWKAETPLEKGLDYTIESFK